MAIDRPSCLNLTYFCREASCAIETRCIEVSEPPDPTTTRSRRSGKTKPELFIQESGKGTRIVTPRKNETLLIECFCEKINRNAETKKLVQPILLRKAKHFKELNYRL